MTIIHGDYFDPDVNALADFFQEFGGEELALQFLSAVRATVDALTGHALAHRPRHLGRFENVRQVPVKDFPNHLVFYLVDEGSGTIEILRLLDGRRNLGPLLT